MCDENCDPKLEKLDRKHDFLLKKVLRYGNKIEEMTLDKWSPRTFTIYQKAVNDLFELIENDYESNARFHYTVTMLRNPANLLINKRIK